MPTGIYNRTWKKMSKKEKKIEKEQEIKEAQKKGFFQKLLEGKD